MPLCKWHAFWMVPRLICYFFVILFYIEGKWLLMRNVAKILPLKSKLSGKLQRFNAIDRSIEMLQNSFQKFSKISIKIKNWEFFERPKQWAALRKLISLPLDKTLLLLWNKNVFKKIYRNIEIYRHLFSKCFRNAVLGRQEIPQCKYLFWHQTETCLLENL